MDFIEEYKREKLQEVLQREKRVNEWRQAFVKEFPVTDMNSMTLENYIITKKGYGKEYSFCAKLRLFMESEYHVQTKRMLPSIFGMSYDYDAKIVLSKKLKEKFGNDYETCFAYIKREIVALLSAAEADDYEKIESCSLDYNLIVILLIIYFPNNFLPTHSVPLLTRYCQKLNIGFQNKLGFVNNFTAGMLYCNLLLSDWKKGIPEMADWSNYVFVGFCDWLYRKDIDFAGNGARRILELQDEKRIKDIEDEIERLNLQGKTKDAIVKVRVNQDLFRKKLLQRYSKCCLCDIDNEHLLVASHIKPWSMSDAHEKLDVENGFLMCPNHDRLFDQGWISFTDEGEIIISSKLLQKDRELLNISDNMRISVTEKNKEYLRYHRNTMQ